MSSHGYSFDARLRAVRQRRQAARLSAALTVAIWTGGLGLVLAIAGLGLWA